MDTGDSLLERGQQSKDEQHMEQKENSSDLKVSSWLPPAKQSQRGRKVIKDDVVRYFLATGEPASSLVLKI